MGTQTDAHSCGICVINAVKASILGDVLFTRETRFRLRLEYFAEAAEYILQDPVRPLHVHLGLIANDVIGEGQGG